MIGAACFACQASTDADAVYSAFPTKFGSLEFMRPSHDVRLNGSTLLTSGQTVDPYGYRLILLEMEPSLAPSGSAQVIESGKSVVKRQIDRIVVADAIDGTCARSFRVLDFRSKRPFVSDRFGFNPEGKSCLKLTRVKWGPKESTIYLDGTLKYIYRIDGKVIGPVE